MALVLHGVRGRRASAPGTSRHRPALPVLALAQLMIVLDATIVIVALPSISSDFDLSPSARIWIVVSYSLAFGSLLLLGGRISDRLGRRRALITGLIGFALASALGGVALNLGMLVVARALQGMFGALLAPSVTSLVASRFEAGRERRRAFAVLGAMAGSGAAIGLVFGGFLTEFLSWRWTLLVNVPIAGLAIMGAFSRLPKDEETRPRSLDVLGTVLASASMLAVVFGFSRVEVADWISLQVLGPLGGGVLLLVLFLAWQSRARTPLLPLRVLADRVRAAGYLSRFVASMGNFAVLFFLTFLLQQSLGFSPLYTGLAMTPMVLGNLLAPRVLGSRRAERVSTSVLTATGLFVGAGALLWLAQLEPSTSYWAGMLGPLMIFGFGQGLAISSTFGLGTQGLHADDVGVGSAMVSVTQQLGGAVGIALLSSISALVMASYLQDRSVADNAALNAGSTAAFLVTAGVFVAAAVATSVLCWRRTT